MKRVLVIGKITGPHKLSHASVRRIVDIRAEENPEQVMYGKYIMAGDLRDPRGATTMVVGGMLHEMADMREEEWGR